MFAAEFPLLALAQGVCGGVLAGFRGQWGSDVSRMPASPGLSTICVPGSAVAGYVCFIELSGFPLGVEIPVQPSPA